MATHKGKQAAKSTRRPKARGKLLPASSTAFPIAGIGASAGGLAALSTLVETLPGKPGLALVVVSHMMPDKTSILHTLLAERSRVPVHQARDGEALEANCIYVAPPGGHLVLRQGTLYHISGTRPEALNSINDFLLSLAHEQGANAAGVVLSGTGSDGTAGLKQIKAAGGPTFAQDPADAQFGQMPSSAIAAGCVERVLRPDEIARQLVRWAASAQKSPAARGSANPYDDIIATLPQLTGVDFTQYKSSTLRRRIAKRVAQQGFADAETYLKHIRTHPEEARALFGELLIRVSSFFRDPEAFRALERKVITPLLRGDDARKSVRVWVPGCARGEEVYTIGMLLLERARGRGPRIQLFGTDLSASDIDAARSGRFGEHIAGEMSPARLKRFFEKVPGGYQVRQELRELCVFACQEVGNDPPFSNLDLISCRNLLIYFARPLQERVIETFHYALKPGGALFLGRSESLIGHPELFALLDSKYRIYRRKPSAGVASRRGTSGPARSAWPHVQAAVSPPSGEAPRMIERFLIDHYAPPGLYIDEDLVIRSFVGDVSPFLQPAAGQANLHLGRMVPAGAALDIRTAIRATQRSPRPVRRETSWIGPKGTARDVTMLLTRVAGTDGRKPGYLVLFERVAPQEQEPVARNVPSRRRDRQELTRLNKQLSATREQLQTVLEEQEQSAEELRAAHEEALSGNEELQSSNEELQTAKEELQSANEELATLNEELQERNQQLDRLAGELSTLIAGVNIPIVHLDRERRVRRFSPAAHAVFNLLATDVGREFSDIKPSLVLPDLDEAISAALQRGTATEREVRDRAGRWHSMRVRPFRGNSGRTEGALLALVDIDATKRNIAAVMETMSEPLLLLDRELHVVMANPAFYRTFRTGERETAGVSLFALGNGQWNVPELRREVSEVLPKRGRFEGLRVQHQFPLIGLKVFRVSGQLVVDESLGTETVLLVLQDVTDIEATAERLRQAREEEEARVAHELHDLSGGALAGLSIELSQLAEEAISPAVSRRLRAVRKRIQELSSSTHDLARRIHPTVVEDLGLRKALLGECRALEERNGTRAALQCVGRVDRLPGPVNLCLYRVVQEALRNVSRHAKAQEVQVELVADTRDVRLTVRDTGGGFDLKQASAKGGLGLIGMADRVSVLNGKFEVDSAPGNGTTIKVVIPLQTAALRAKKTRPEGRPRQGSKTASRKRVK